MIVDFLYATGVRVSECVNKYLTLAAEKAGNSTYTGGGGTITVTPIE